MNKEMLETAEKAQPEMMKKTAMMLSLIEKMAPEFLEDVVEEFEIISDVTHEKVAAAVVPGLSGLVGAGLRAYHAGTGVAAVAATAVAAGLGTALATDLFDAAKRGLTKSRNFKRIMSSNPKLKDEIVDKARLKPAFDALHRYAPDFTADPLVGGSLLRSLANQPAGNEYQLISQLLGARKNLVDIKDKNFRADFKGARELLLKADSKGSKDSSWSNNSGSNGSGSSVSSGSHRPSPRPPSPRPPPRNP